MVEEDRQVESYDDSVQQQNDDINRENEEVHPDISENIQYSKYDQISEHENGISQVNKKKLKTRKHKKRKKNRSSKPPGNESTKSDENFENEPEFEYIHESVSLIDLAPQHRQFFQIFEKFKISDSDSNQIIPPPQLVVPTNLSGINTANSENADRHDEDEPKKDKPIISNRKLKQKSRVSMAELKQLVDKPNVVETHDVNARDPQLLLHLKTYRNTVPVPRHWCYKSKYLQGKKGFVKPPFKLPEFIRNTGITEMRAVFQEKEEAKSLKSKMREQIRPKMGKIDIDYGKLHAAFFKHQTKPKLTLHGDLYYEGKELETRLLDKKPGNLSEELCNGLGMPVGNLNMPPPWLIAMQRYGPPPSYSNLKLPGLNAPIPIGCTYGYHAGGWGKPPIDESGKPLYGDVFGENTIHNDDFEDDFKNSGAHWGEYGSEDESEEEIESEVEDKEETKEVENQSGLLTPIDGLETPSETLNTFSGLETPDSIELRKRKIEKEMESNEMLNLYEVLPEKPVTKLSGTMMASTHVYDMKGVGLPPPALLSGNSQSRANLRKNEVTISLDPENLKLDDDTIEKRYKQQQDAQLHKDDFSDMVLEHVNKQKKTKRKRQDDQDTTKKVKKYKDFKF